MEPDRPVVHAVWVAVSVLIVTCPCALSLAAPATLVAAAGALARHGMLVGVVIAAQLAWSALNLGIPWLSYGRLRPLHNNAVIFAFGSSVLFATSYHMAQRTGQTRLFMPGLAMFTFLGWQLVIVLATITLPLGITSSKEYAELE